MKIRDAWPDEKKLNYEEHPLELITRLIEERDSERAEKLM